MTPFEVAMLVLAALGIAWVVMQILRWNTVFRPSRFDGHPDSWDDDAWNEYLSLTNGPWTFKKWLYKL